MTRILIKYVFTLKICQTSSYSNLLTQITSRFEIDRETSDISCVVKCEDLNVDNVWPARCIENDSFRVEDTRIETFTEEVLNFKLPDHHHVESRKSLAVLNDVFNNSIG